MKLFIDGCRDSGKLMDGTNAATVPRYINEITGLYRPETNLWQPKKQESETPIVCIGKYTRAFPRWEDLQGPEWHER